MDKRIHTAAALQEQAERRARLLAPSQSTRHIGVITEWRGRVKPGHINVLHFKRFTGLGNWTFESFKNVKWEDTLDARVFRGHKLLCSPSTNEVFVEQVYVGDVPIMVKGHPMPFAMFGPLAIGMTLDMPTKPAGQSLRLHAVTEKECRVTIHFVGYMPSEANS